MIQEKYDVYKEVLIFLAYFDDEVIDKIPDEVLTKLTELAAKSNSDYYVDVEKSLENQKMSEEAKNLISLIYYNYLADEKEKKELWELWDDNEKTYKDQLKEKYGTNLLFREQSKVIPKIEKNSEPNVSIIKKESFFNKILNFIKRKK